MQMLQGKERGSSLVALSRQID